MTDKTYSWLPSVSVRPKADESARGFLIRACEENGWPSLASFMGPVGIRQSEFVKGNDHLAMARAFEASLEEMEAVSLNRSAQSVQIMGHTFHIARVRTRERRVCLACLDEDRYQRAWWDLNLVTVCHRHGTPLQSSCVCGRPLGWQDPNLSLCPKCSAVMSRIATSPPVPRARRMGFQSWLLGRLGMQDGAVSRREDGASHRLESPILDDLPVGRAIKVVEAAALLAEFGYRDAEPRFDSLDGDPADNRERGFRLVCIEVSPLLEILQPQLRKRTGYVSPAVPLHFFGWFSQYIIDELLDKDYEIERNLMLELNRRTGQPVGQLAKLDYMPIGQLAYEHRLTAREAYELIQNRAGRFDCVGSFPNVFVKKHIRFAWSTLGIDGWIEAHDADINSSIPPNNSKPQNRRIGARRSLEAKPD